MGDAGDYWREHREHLRSQGISRSRPRRSATLVKFKKEHERMGFRRCTDWHWQMRLGGALLDYWPSKQKWRHRDVTIVGDFEKLSAFIADKKQERTDV